MKLSEFKTPGERREFLEKKAGIRLDSIAQALPKDPGEIHCENIIGATVLPLGVAGPLTIKGDAIDGDFYIPLATTEGALVASVSRGCKAIAQAGGAITFAARAGITRGPVFDVGSLENQKKLFKWIQINFSTLQKIAKETSSHLVLREAKFQGTSNYLFIRFSYDTGDAMGMNMVTIATTKLVEHIKKETGVSCLAVAGNYDIDKKPAWLNFIDNRGFCGWADAVIKRDIVKEVLKTTPEKIFDTWLAKCMIGSAMSGSLGFNAHFSNIVAALFAATGQDLAHVVEGSMGITVSKVLQNGDLYISIYMPALILGTVGGGTKMKIKKEALAILGIKKSEELAEIMVGAVLAGELSLLASLSAGSLGSAHEKLGR